MNNTRWKPTPLIRLSILFHGAALVGLALEPRLWPLALSALLANHLLLTLLGLWPRSRLLGANWTRLPAASIQKRQVALTIDDGPDPLVTAKVLDVLDRYAVKATFFCIGAQAARYPDLCREIARRGHDVQNHTQNHRLGFALMGSRGLRRELQTAQDTLTTITGQRPKFFRAPAGIRSPLLDPVLSSIGLRLVSWSVRGFDSRESDVERVQRLLIRGLMPGAILLMHDGNAAHTREGSPIIMEVLPELLATGKAAGLRFVTLRETLL